MKDIPSLVSSSPLEDLQLFNTIVMDDVNRLDDFVTAIISTHGSRLKRFSLHRLPISLKALDDVCAGFTNLEQLFILVEQEDLVSLAGGYDTDSEYTNEFQESIGTSLSKATRLQAVHINFVTLQAEGSHSSYVSTRDALRIVNRCSPTVTQIGCATRVWQVSLVPNVRFG